MKQAWGRLGGFAKSPPTPQVNVATRFSRLRPDSCSNVSTWQYPIKSYYGCLQGYGCQLISVLLPSKCSPVIQSGFVRPFSWLLDLYAITILSECCTWEIKHLLAACDSRQRTYKTVRGSTEELSRWQATVSGRSGLPKTTRTKLSCNTWKVSILLCVSLLYFCHLPYSNQINRRRLWRVIAAPLNTSPPPSAGAE